MNESSALSPLKGNIKFPLLSKRLSESILSGKLKGKLPGVHLLAQEYGVNARTISKAMEELERQGLVRLSGRRGTFALPPKERRARTKTIAVVSLILHQGRTSPVAALLEDKARENGDRVTSLVYHSRQALADHHDFITSLAADGFIFTNSSLDLKLAQKLQEKDIPFVSVNRADFIPDLNWVDTDNVGGLREGLLALARLGHKRIGFFTMHSPVDRPFSLAELRDVYESALKPMGLSRPELFVSLDQEEMISRYDEKADEMAAGECWTALFSGRIPPPTALLVTSTDLGRAFLKLFSEKKVRIPEDLSFLVSSGEDNDPKDGFLSIIDNPVREKFEIALSRLQTLIRTRDREATSLVIPRKLILKTSVRAL